MLKSAIGKLHNRAIFDRRTRVLSNILYPLFPPNARVLDVGTGDGLIASLWQSARPDIAVEGIDVFTRAATRIPVKKFDGHHIPFDDKNVDVVTFIDVIHHADDAAALLKEAARVARNSIIIKDHLAENAFDHATLRFMDWVGNAPHGVSLPYNYFSRTEWTEQFQRAHIHPIFFETKIPLYPMPFNFIFGRGLHFLARCAIE